MIKIFQIINFSKIVKNSLVVYIILLGFIEIMAYWKEEFWSILAAYIWLILGIYFITTSVYQVLKAIFQDIKVRFFWGIFILLFFLDIPQ